MPNYAIKLAKLIRSTHWTQENGSIIEPLFRTRDTMRLQSRYMRVK